MIEPGVQRDDVRDALSHSHNAAQSAMALVAIVQQLTFERDEARGMVRDLESRLAAAEHRLSVTSGALSSSGVGE